MELMNCRNCKKIFNYITGEHICPGCKEALEKKFQVVKEFIRGNPGKNVNQVAEECEVTTRQIKKWVREERLSFTDDSLVGLECERCGKMIHSGRFCNECAGGLTDAMNDLYREKAIARKSTSSGARMRFLD